MEVNEPRAKYLSSHELQPTEIGPLPMDWSVSTVGDEFHVQLGKMLDTENNVGVPKPFLGNRAVQWGRVDVSDIGEIRMSPSDLQRYRLANGDLLVCEGGEVGRSAIWRDQLEECYYQKALHRLRAKRGYSHDLMAAVLEQFARSGKLQNYVTQTSIAHLPKEKFVALPIPMPATKDEQRWISQAIGDADALIDSLEQLLAKKRQIKQGAMQELLTGKRRLPGFDGGWTMAKIAALESRGILELSRGKVISKKSIAGNPGEYPIYSSSVHNNGLFGCYGSFMFDEELITWSVDGGGDFFHRPRHKFSVTNVCGYMRVREGISCKFLAMQLQQQHSTKSFDYQTKAHPSVVRAEYSVQLPELSEQTAIAQVLSDMDADIAATEARLSKARDLKQAMAQALLTGRVRLV
ncbi:MAG: restriction endonuclease subunit S [Sphaerotilus natans subsp. sulfidivorans]|uniref:restriction endonuclease subunit S n=1 Tax=Sphaerotilus sulfidivorans TaxID=639200 RepID=UPI002355C9C6|nr:restriction endonuclease subunit S [Sphaerotilus sulfidivorans]MCK6404285.1 restriction endonuclease subunit S [Sphaerotilus sulfidivorans]